MPKLIRITARHLFDILLSISLGVAGVCLIVGCLYIYFGAGVYSRELVATVFQKIAVPIWTAVGLTVVGIVWEWCVPSEDEHHKSPKAYGVMLARLHDTRDTHLQDAAIRAEQRRRRLLGLVRISLALIGLSVFFGYAVQPTHYTDDINASVIRSMWVAIPCFAVPITVSLVTTRLTHKSLEREIALLRSCPPMETFPAMSPQTTAPCVALTVLRIVLSVLALAALIYGFTAGGTADVLTKAINICTECIGLG